MKKHVVLSATAALLLTGLAQAEPESFAIGGGHKADRYESGTKGEEIRPPETVTTAPAAPAAASAKCRALKFVRPEAPLPIIPVNFKGGNPEEFKACGNTVVTAKLAGARVTIKLRDRAGNGELNVPVDYSGEMFSTLCIPDAEGGLKGVSVYAKQVGTGDTSVTLAKLDPAFYDEAGIIATCKAMRESQSKGY